MLKGTGKEQQIIQWATISLAVFAMLSYYLNIFCRFDQLIISTQDSIVAGRASSPNKYRILVPYLNEFLSKLSMLIIGNPAKGMIFTFTVSAFIGLNYVFMVKLARQIFGNYQAIILFLFCYTILLVAGMNHHSYQPWSYLESTLFIAGAWCFLANKHIIVFVILSALAVVNRETGIFLALIPIFHLAGNKSSGTKALPYYVNLICSVILLVVLRLTLGNSNEALRLKEIFITNLQPLHLILLPLIVVSGLLLLPFTTKQPSFPLKNIKYLFILYLIPVILFGRWLEIRMLLPFGFYLVTLMVNTILSPLKKAE